MPHISDNWLNNLKFCSSYQNIVIPAIDQLNELGLYITQVKMGIDKASIEIKAPRNGELKSTGSVIVGRNNFARCKLAGCTIVWVQR